MCHRDYVDHASPEGDGPMDRYETYGHQTNISGENLARVSPPPSASPVEVARKITDGWMNSEGHRENILRPEFDREGIGVYVSRTGSVYATQNFE